MQLGCDGKLAHHFFTVRMGLKTPERIPEINLEPWSSKVSLKNTLYEHEKLGLISLFVTRIPQGDCKLTNRGELHPPLLQHCKCKRMFLLCILSMRSNHAPRLFLSSRSSVFPSLTFSFPAFSESIYSAGKPKECFVQACRHPLLNRADTVGDFSEDIRGTSV